LQEANELKEQISQLHPGVLMISAMSWDSQGSTKEILPYHN
jgi:hypothetical protein